MASPTLLEAFEIVNEIFDLPEAERQAVLSRRCNGRADLVAEIERIEAAPLTTRSVPCLAPVLEILLTGIDQVPAPGLFTGVIIGPHLVGEILGSGGMGHVYRAVHSGHNGAVALKVLQFRNHQLADRIARLQHEAKLLARCHHPGIVQIYHLDRLPATASSDHPLEPGAYFTMELVDGAPITVFCAEKGFSFKQRLELFVRVCEAVQAAHDVGVIHRDLKPNNILANSDGIKLLNFGVAEAFGGNRHPMPLLYVRRLCCTGTSGRNHHSHRRLLARRSVRRTAARTPAFKITGDTPAA